MTNTNEVGDQLRLDLLREALPYIQRFQGQTFVVKLSGKATEDHANLRSLAEELALLHQVGIRICVVHGGGKQLSELASRMGSGLTRWPVACATADAMGPARGPRCTGSARARL